jgi:Lar family restriction alleviation protein
MRRAACGAMMTNEKENRMLSIAKELLELDKDIARTNDDVVWAGPGETAHERILGVLHDLYEDALNALNEAYLLNGSGETGLEELKPCPFCGSKTMHVYKTGVEPIKYCVSCDGCGSEGPWEETTWGSGARWNRRPLAQALAAETQND